MFPQPTPPPPPASSAHPRPPGRPIQLPSLLSLRQPSRYLPCLHSFVFSRMSCTWGQVPFWVDFTMPLTRKHLFMIQSFTVFEPCIGAWCSQCSGFQACYRCEALLCRWNLHLLSGMWWGMWAHSHNAICVFLSEDLMKVFSLLFTGLLVLLF